MVQLFADSRAVVDVAIEITYHDHPALSVSVPKDPVSLDDDRDGAVLRVTISNALPCVRFQDLDVVNRTHSPSANRR